MSTIVEYVLILRDLYFLACGRVANVTRGQRVMQRTGGDAARV